MLACNLRQFYGGPLGLDALAGEPCRDILVFLSIS